MDQDKQRTYTGRSIEFQRKEWRVQRVGWAVMGLIVVLASLGLLGSNGPFAKAEREAADGSLEVSYLRLDRHHAPGELSVEVAPEFALEGEIRLWIEQDFADRLEFTSIVPEPERVEIQADQIVYVFAVGDQSGPLPITYFYEHNGYWREGGRLGLVNGEAIELSQFVFP